jgi:hypothetical protein
MDYEFVIHGVLVRTSGLEPPTPCMSSKYSNQLSYALMSRATTIIIAYRSSFVKGFL